MERHQGEEPSHYRRRRYCGTECANTANTLVQSVFTGADGRLRGLTTADAF